MSTTHSRRRVGTRLTRSTSSKSKDLQHSKSPSSIHSPDDIPVPESGYTEVVELDRMPSHSSSSSMSFSSTSLSSHSEDALVQAKHSSFSPEALRLEDVVVDSLQDPTSPSHEPSTYTSIYTPSRSTFSSSVSSKRKASSSDIDPNNLRRSVRQRAEASPFRLDSTEAQRDSTLFISQPQTPSKFKQMAVSPSNRKDSLFMSLPASFHNDHNGSSNKYDAQYAPIFDISLLSANSNMFSFLPAETQKNHSATTDQAREPSSNTTNHVDLSPSFDLLQYNHIIAPFPPTPQPAFLNFPQSPRFSGTFTVAPCAISGPPSSSSTSFFPVPNYSHQILRTSGTPNPFQPREQQQDDIPVTPLPTRPLPRRARKSSVCSSNAGSIIVKHLDGEDEEEEDNEAEDGAQDEDGDDTAHPYETTDDNPHKQQEDKDDAEEDDERFALFASQVRRKAEALSLRSSQNGSTHHQSSAAEPATPSKSHNVTTSGAGSPLHSDRFETPTSAPVDHAGADFRQQQQQQEEEEHVDMRRRYAEDGAGASYSAKQNKVQNQPFELPPMPSPLPPLPPQYQTENELYRDQYSSFPHCVEPDMGISPTKSGKAKRGHHNKDRGGKPPRPPNCFILYRSDKVEEIRAKQQMSKDKMQKDISKAVAESWRLEPQSVKDEYTRRANAAREEHLLKYPGYVYQPTRKDKLPDEEVSPFKRSGSARPRSMTSELSKSAPASRLTHLNVYRHDNEDWGMSEIDDRAVSPSPSKAAARARTPLKQSRIPVPMSVNKATSSTFFHRGAQEQQALRQSTVPISSTRPPQYVKRATAIAQNAESFAAQRGINQARTINGHPASASMAQSRSTPSNMQYHNSASMPQSPSAPRYAQPTAASMSKSTSQPLPVSDHASRERMTNPHHQYAQYAHIQHPLPLSPTQTGNNRTQIFEQMMSSTPSNQHRLVFPDMSPPDASLIAPTSAGDQSSADKPVRSGVKSSGNRPLHQRAHTSQAALATGPAATVSRTPNMRKTKMTPQQSSPADDAGSLAIPDGFVIGGKLYPAENVKEAMKAYHASRTAAPKPVNRIPSDHSTNSNGPHQELTIPPQWTYTHQQPQMQYITQPPQQNYVIGIAPDGQQIPLLLSQPQNGTTYEPWQNVPAFMPSSTQATPSTSLEYDFKQVMDPMQQFDYSMMYTPNTANSNMTNMPSSSGLWFPQQGSANQGADYSQYLLSTDSFNNGTSPTFFLNDQNGHQQEYVLAGPSVEIDNATGFAMPQESFQWTST